MNNLARLQAGESLQIDIAYWALGEKCHVYHRDNKAHLYHLAKAQHEACKRLREAGVKRVRIECGVVVPAD